jgi:hypothetical protein
MMQQMQQMQQKPAFDPDMPAQALAIQAVQGTPGAEPIGSVPITIQFFNQQTQEPFETIETQLDEHGVIMLEDLPLDRPFIPVAQIEYAGVTYSASGELMSQQAPQQKLVIDCYEVTEEAPPWQVTMRAVQAVPTEDGGFLVRETVAVSNPAQQTWLGTPTGGEQRATTAFDIPDVATDIELGQGFHGWCCTTHIGSTLINHLPLMPGQTTMIYQYFMPAQEGGTQLAVSCPAPTRMLAVMLPQGMETNNLMGGLQQADIPAGMGGMGGQGQMFSRQNVPPGETVGLMLASTAGGSVERAQLNKEAESQDWAKILGIGGAIFALIVGAFFIFIKSPKGG